MPTLDSEMLKMLVEKYGDNVDLRTLKTHPTFLDDLLKTISLTSDPTDPTLPQIYDKIGGGTGTYDSTFDKQRSPYFSAADLIRQAAVDRYQQYERTETGGGVGGGGGGGYDRTYLRDNAMTVEVTGRFLDAIPQDVIDKIDPQILKEFQEILGKIKKP